MVTDGATSNRFGVSVLNVGRVSDVLAYAPSFAGRGES